MTTPDLAAIVRKLSPKEAGALRTLPRIDGNNPGREYTALLDHGLADCTVLGAEDGERWRIWATPLGKQVRAHLLSEKTDV